MLAYNWKLTLCAILLFFSAFIFLPQTPQNGHKFYPRVENLTNIQFNQNEVALLNKGVKYENHNKNNIVKLSLDAICAIQK